LRDMRTISKSPASRSQARQAHISACHIESHIGFPKTAHQDQGHHTSEQYKIDFAIKADLT
jgi:hypothetical protein